MSENRSSEIQTFQSFCTGAGISGVTGWRWRGRGWIEVLTIAGRPYVTAEEIARFKRRAAAGEFETVTVRSARSLPTC
jgi:hypothetical protein